MGSDIDAAVTALGVTLNRAKVSHERGENMVIGVELLRSFVVQAGDLMTQLLAIAGSSACDNDAFRQSAPSLCSWRKRCV